MRTFADLIAQAKQNKNTKGITQSLTTVDFFNVASAMAIIASLWMNSVGSVAVVILLWSLIVVPLRMTKGKITDSITISLTANDIFKLFTFSVLIVSLWTHTVVLVVFALLVIIFINTISPSTRSITTEK